MSILTEIISEVVDALGLVESLGIRVDWLDWTLRKIHKAREHCQLIQNVNLLKGQVEELRKQLDSIKHLIKYVDEKLGNREMDSTSIVGFQIQVFEDPCATE